MFIEHIREQILPLIWQSIQKREEMGFIAKDDLSSDSGRGRSLAYCERRGP